MILTLIVSSFLSLFALSAQAAISIPSGLTDGEQERVLQIIGFGTSFRPIDNPYPLGGYSGLELGLSVESIPTADIGRSGRTGTIDRNLMFPRLNIGKGIFDNMDLFFSFMPQNESTGVGIYSGALRWGFFQATFLPACFSVLLSATNTNFNNIFISQSYGVDLISGVNADPFSFYVGAGTFYGQGQFDASLTYNSTETNQVGRAFHTMIGMNITLSDFFAAFEIDNYHTTVVSGKLGSRF